VFPREGPLQIGPSRPKGTSECQHTGHRRRTWSYGEQLNNERSGAKPGSPSRAIERPVLTGELRSQIDKIWNDFWSGGISNPLEVIEQLTYLLFLKRLDDLETLEENKANRLGEPMAHRNFPALLLDPWVRFARVGVGSGRRG
jgi:hypothetical protein